MVPEDFSSARELISINEFTNSQKWETLGLSFSLNISFKEVKKEMFRMTLTPFEEALLILKSLHEEPLLWTITFNVRISKCMF